MTEPDRIPTCPVIEPVPVSPPPPGSCPFQSATGATFRNSIGSLIEPTRIRFSPVDTKSAPPGIPLPGNWPLNGSTLPGA